MAAPHCTAIAAHERSKSPKALGLAGERGAPQPLLRVETQGAGRHAGYTGRCNPQHVFANFTQDYFHYPPPPLPPVPQPPGGELLLFARLGGERLTTVRCCPHVATPALRPTPPYPAAR